MKNNTSLMANGALTFLRAGIVQRRGLIRCGFELETQSSEGLSASDEGESELDEGAYYEAVGERVSEIIGSDLENNISSALYRSVREAVTDSVCDNDELRNEHYTSGTDALDTVRGQAPSGIEVVLDSSVSGFEFRTKNGGVTYPEFCKKAVSLFRMDHTIDVGCSFHIHLSVANVKHTYGERIQMALTEYLVENIDRVPESVQERWKGIEDNQYISKLLGSDDEKYCFVRKHPQGTWEFRCFGNVDNAKDARTCLNLAIEAMAFAYKVQAGEAVLIADSMPTRSAWTNAVRKSLVETKSLSAWTRTSRLATQRRRAA